MSSQSSPLSSALVRVHSYELTKYLIFRYFKIRYVMQISITQQHSNLPFFPSKVGCAGLARDNYISLAQLLMFLQNLKALECLCAKTGTVASLFFLYFKDNTTLILQNRNMFNW